jgi:universal stress protein A
MNDSRNHIICAVDVNDYDQQVIELAETFARRFDAVLDLVHVTLFPDPTNAAWPAYLGSPATMIAEHRRLRAIGDEIGGVDVRHHHLTGTPSDRLVDFINQQSPLMVVLGTHGRKGLSRIVGSVATSVLRQATCPVLVLRQHQNSQQFADLPSH